MYERMIQAEIDYRRSRTVPARQGGRRTRARLLIGTDRTDRTTPVKRAR